LTFPDGTDVSMSECGSGGHQTSGLSEYIYFWESVGDYGIVAAQHIDEAIDRLNASCGKNWFCD